MRDHLRSASQREGEQRGIDPYAGERIASTSGAIVVSEGPDGYRPSCSDCTLIPDQRTSVLTGASAIVRMSGDLLFQGVV
jgi:hypothetical protein